MKKIKLFMVRLSVAYNILFRPGKKQHWFIIWMTREELIKLFQGDLTEFAIVTHKLQRFNVINIAKVISAAYDEIDYAIEKAEFEAESELHFNKN